MTNQNQNTNQHPIMATMEFILQWCHKYMIYLTVGFLFIVMIAYCAYDSYGMTDDVESKRVKKKVRFSDVNEYQYI